MAQESEGGEDRSEDNIFCDPNDGEPANLTSLGLLYAFAPAPISLPWETATLTGIVLYHRTFNSIERDGIDVEIPAPNTIPIHCGDVTPLYFEFEKGVTWYIWANGSPTQDGDNLRAFTQLMKAADAYCRSKYTSARYAVLQKADPEDEYYAFDYGYNGKLESCANNDKGIAYFTFKPTLYCANRRPC